MSSMKELTEVWHGMHFGIKLDLADAFKHVGVRKEDRTYFGLEFQGRWFVETALPFGWSESPRIYASMAEWVRGLAAAAGVTLMIYVDDILVMGASKEEAQRSALWLRWMLQNLGIKVNEAKSMTEAVRQLEYLGYLVNISKKTISIAADKRTKIKIMAAREIRASYTTARRIAQFLGVLQGARLALQWLNPATAAIYRWLSYTIARGKFDEYARISPEARKEMRYWANLKRWQTITLYKQAQTFALIESDASHTGLGLKISTEQGSRVWEVAEPFTQQEAAQHSTARELRCALRGFEIMEQFMPKGAKIRWSTDCTAVEAILKKYRTHSRDLFTIGKHIARMVKRNRWLLEPVHIPGEQNITADQLSRKSWDSTETGLQKVALEWIEQATKRVHTLDLFASRAMHMLPRYVTRYKDPQAAAFDGLSMDWTEEVLYADPPVCILPGIVDRIEHEKRHHTRFQMTLIVPRWQSKRWYQRLMGMAESVFLLPRGLDTRRHMDGTESYSNWATMVCKI